MTPQLTVNLLRALFVTFAVCVGVMIGDNALGSGVIGAMLGAVFGLAVVLADRLMRGISVRVFSSATFGLLIGFIFSQLLLASRLLAGASPQVQWITGLIVYSAFGYLGMMLAVRSNRDEFSLIIPYVRFRQSTVQDAPLLIDTNIIIDGRLPEVCATGFLSSSLVVPRFVLDELQVLADSADPQTRERGRSALERLQQLQRNPALSVTIHETEADPGTSVDTRLTKLASVLEARLLTNDPTQASAARLQNVMVLNLNDLARAMRPVFCTGDETELSLVKEGRDLHQAVGYLPDGTMVVVNHGRPHLGRTVRVVIGSSLHTSAGQLFFAELKKAA
ncbi:MAG: hypothetical protein QOE70_6184 [Chthoniobacter sp.]|jgi:uncharacterized protein YacL|nr:hypothetical protein [Chthoniobacter sp.]